VAGGGKGFRDPIITGAHGTDGDGAGGITDAAFDTYITSEPEGDLKACAAALKTYRELTNLTSRTGVNNSGSGLGANVTFANTTWAAFHTEVGTFGSNCAKRVVEIDARIGVPVYANSTSTGTTAAVRGKPPCIRVKTIPTANATSGYVPYGREIYDNVNLLLGQDVDLLGGIIKDIEGLGDLVTLVKNARNKYEIYNGRAKEY
jgi:hypothetical protein